MQKIVFAAVAVFGLATATSAAAIEEIKITAASGLPSFSAGTGEVINVFIPEIDKRLAAKGNYKITWTTGWGGAIANQFELFEAIEDGLEDLEKNRLVNHAKVKEWVESWDTPSEKSVPKCK